jgi:hypothetical protein
MTRISNVHIKVLKRDNQRYPSVRITTEDGNTHVRNGRFRANQTRVAFTWHGILLNVLVADPNQVIASVS